MAFSTQITINDGLLYPNYNKWWPSLITINDGLLYPKNIIKTLYIATKCVHNQQNISKFFFLEIYFVCIMEQNHIKQLLFTGDIYCK